MRIAVAGATGFVGRRLIPALEHAGHEVVAISRRGPVPVDVRDEPATTLALTGCDSAYYLVHSMTEGEFVTSDRDAALAFGRAARTAGVGRIIYLGGLGTNPDSDHLVSRQEVGRLLGDAGVAVVELRAAVVLGSGSISFEMLRCLTERLPMMVCPRWVRTRIQPVAARDMDDYLVQSLGVEPGIYEIGGRDVTSYREMIAAYARVRGLHRRRIIDIPLLTPHLSSYWVDFVTPVDRRVSHALIESLSTEVVVTDATRSARAFNVTPLGLDDALRLALDEQEAAVSSTLMDLESGLVDGVEVIRVEVALNGTSSNAVDGGLDAMGGDWHWYGIDAGWRWRARVGRLFGERFRLRRPPRLVAGASVDWWTVLRRAPSELALRGDGWKPGEAWLGFRVQSDRLVSVGALRTKGVGGWLYWNALRPMHRRSFVAQTRHRVDAAGRS